MCAWKNEEEKDVCVWCQSVCVCVCVCVCTYHCVTIGVPWEVSHGNAVLCVCVHVCVCMNE